MTNMMSLLSTNMKCYLNTTVSMCMCMSSAFIWVSLDKTEYKAFIYSVDSNLYCHYGIVYQIKCYLMKLLITLNSVWIIFGHTKTCYMITTQICMASETVFSYGSIMYITSSIQWYFSDTEASEACVRFLDMMWCDGYGRTITYATHTISQQLFGESPLYSSHHHLASAYYWCRQNA